MNIECYLWHKTLFYSLSQLIRKYKNFHKYCLFRLNSEICISFPMNLLTFFHFSKSSQNSWFFFKKVIILLKGSILWSFIHILKGWGIKNIYPLSHSQTLPTLSVMERDSHFCPVLEVRGTQWHQISVPRYKMSYLPSTVDKGARWTGALLESLWVALLCKRETNIAGVKCKHTGVGVLIRYAGGWAGVASALIT